MTFGLVMIVRDEASNIVRCLDSVKHLLSSWTIVDTGSTDNTPELIHDTLDPVAGVLHRRGWVDFRTNRTEALQLAHGTADYLFMLDADMVLHHPDPIPALTLDCYQGRVRGSSNDYTLPLLVSGRRRWKYEGVAHSYLAAAEGNPHFSEDELAGLAVDDHSSTGPDKLRRDLDALSAEHARNPLDARTAFYLAQTYSDLDMFPEAIAAYRTRTHLDGWSEENYVSKLRLGSLLGEHVGVDQSIPVLLDAWQTRPSRAEALRVMAALANSVADKIPYPNDRLFVNRRHYNIPEPARAFPSFPSIDPRSSRRPRVTKKKGLNPADVTAIIVTRGNVDLKPVLDPLPFEEVVVWNNAERPVDYKPFGRYAAIPEARNPVVYWQDDDVIFDRFDDLLAAYQPGRLVCNMDAAWINGAGYRDVCGMQGAGSLCDSHLPAQVWARYLKAHPWDDDAMVEADFVFGTLAPFTVVDLGYRAREFADGPDRLYTQPGQTERKHAMIQRCRAMLEATA